MKLRDRTACDFVRLNSWGSRVRMMEIVRAACVPTDSSEDRDGIIECPGKFPLLASLVWFRLQHHSFHYFEVVFAYVVFAFYHSLDG